MTGRTRGIVADSELTRSVVSKGVETANLVRAQYVGPAVTPQCIKSARPITE